MIRILAFDQSITRTGWAVYDVPSKESTIVCGSFSCSEPADDGEKCDMFATEARKLRTQWKPDFIAWEMASRRISSFAKTPDFADEKFTRMTVNAKVLMLPELQGIIRGIAVAYLLPHEAVPAGVWRASVFGRGGGNLPKAEAKARAVETCRLLGIKVANHDEAEAGCVALWAGSASQRFKSLRWRKEIENEAVSTNLTA